MAHRKTYQRLIGDISFGQRKKAGIMPSVCIKHTDISHTRSCFLYKHAGQADVFPPGFFKIKIKIKKKKKT